MTDMRGLRLREQHEPGHRCQMFHCYSHSVDEIGRSYLSCGECGHSFPSKHALRRDHRRGGWPIYWSDVKHPALMPRELMVEAGFKPIGPVRARLQTARMMIHVLFIKTKNITFCPHCLHDL